MPNNISTETLKAMIDALNIQVMRHDTQIKSLESDNVNSINKMYIEHAKIKEDLQLKIEESTSTMRTELKQEMDNIKNAQAARQSIMSQFAISISSVLLSSILLFIIYILLHGLHII